ncbi:hypothetical protein GXM_02119 [Nostoc sphaeroides CCNUC1]|uniref:Uncharacterized protein n=1 Tax=Nostoc sphaeroides CCNUC1 TaxID=2653204 RepID=A0A5P8VW98_9NOSO|nr:hypothetical protein GXM_02119 [Nostoc sphaeroides CCNUC1]
MQAYFKVGRECILGVVGCQSTNQVVLLLIGNEVLRLLWQKVLKRVLYILQLSI